jgi:hypothetical protein
VTHTASPALHADNCVTAGEDTEFNGIHDAPLETPVDVFLPWCLVEVGFLLVEEEGIHTTIKMGVLERSVRLQGIAKSFL